MPLLNHSFYYYVIAHITIRYCQITKVTKEIYEDVDLSEITDSSAKDTDNQEKKINSGDL